MPKVTHEKPDTVTRTEILSVQTYKQSDGTIVVTTGRCGGPGKGKEGGRYGGKFTIK